MTSRTTYDSNGNRTDGTTVGDDNRLTSDGTYSYVYDGEGNMTLRYDGSGNARVMTYDYRNRLIEVQDYTGATVTEGVFEDGTLAMNAQYTYDINNLRITKVVDDDGDGTDLAVATHFVYDGQSIVLQFDDTTLSHRYFNGPQLDQVLADDQVGSSVVWVYADNLGSVRDLSDASGNWTSHIAYDSFGHVTNTPDATILFGFTGAVHDGETGLDYHRARYYDAAVGRWITQDPIGFFGDSSNLYRYVGNGPTNATDPSGRLSSSIVSTVYRTSSVVYDFPPGSGRVVTRQPSSLAATVPRYTVKAIAVRESANCWRLGQASVKFWSEVSLNDSYESFCANGVGFPRRARSRTGFQYMGRWTRFGSGEAGRAHCEGKYISKQGGLRIGRDKCSRVSIRCFGDKSYPAKHTAVGRIW